MLIRAERERDLAEIHALHVAAFETPAEACLVDALRERVQPIVSLVAEEDSSVIGHILFSPVSLADRPDVKIMGLAPMAIAPDRQRSGVGSALVRAGLERCKESGFGAVVVLGHAEYYPRFGFSPSTNFDICCEYEVPEEAFMALELKPGYLRDESGAVRYHPAFNEL